MSADRTPIDWANRRDLLRTFRDLADDSVDELVAEFDARQPTIGRSELVGAVMDRASGAEGTSQDELIDAFMGDQPDWRDAGFDEELVLAGQRFFAEHQWTLNLSFLLGSLPMSYCGASGATVLVRTGNFTDEPQRRVFETANLVLELAREGELVPGGRGYLMLRRLRLLHAVVRRVVEQGEWDGIDDGRAVNQLQLLGTLWCFAITSLDVLDRSDIEVSDDDRVAWVHLWNVVGHLLGVVPPEVLGEGLLPMEEAEARACFEEIQAEEFHESADGRLLARKLVGVVRELMPHRFADHVVDGSMRLYLTDRWADTLGLRRVDVGWVQGAVRWVWRNPGRWGRWLRRPVRRKLAGLHRNFMSELNDRLADDDVPSLRDQDADDRLRAQLDLLHADADVGFLPQPARRRSQR